MIIDTLLNKNMYKLHKYCIDNYEVIKDCIWLHLNKNARLLLKENLNEFNFRDDILKWRFLNEDRLEWISLPYKITAIHILNENQYNFDWEVFNINSKIFTYDYELMKNKMKNSGIAEELMAYIFNPKNMNKWNEWGFTEHQEMMEFIDI